MDDSNNDNDNDYISCMYQNNLKMIPLDNDFAKFCLICLKEFGKENDKNDLEFFIIKNTEEKILIQNQKDFNKYILKDNEEIILNFDYKKVKREKKTPNNEIEDLKKRINELSKILDEQKEDIEFLKCKNQELEKKNMKLEKELHEYKNLQNLTLSKVKNEISNLSLSVNSIVNKRKDYDYEKINNFLYKENQNTTSQNYEDENEKPIQRKKKIYNNNIIEKKNYENNNENNRYNNNIIEKKNYENNDENNRYNNNYDMDNNNYDEEEENVNQNYKKNNPNNNYSEIKTPDNELNEQYHLNKNSDYNIINNSTLTNNNLENDLNKKEDKNNISFDFIIDKRILLKIKSLYLGKKHTIQYKIKIKNTGYYPIPKSTLKSNFEKSDLGITDTLINNGEEILPNQIIDVTLFIFFKDSNNIKNGINYLYINLYDDENDEIIGNEGIIKIKIEDESRNIEDYIESNEGKKNENNSFFNNLDIPEIGDSYENLEFIKNNNNDSD